MSDNNQVSAEKKQSNDPLKEFNTIYTIFPIIGGILAYNSSGSPLGALVGASFGLIFGHLAVLISASIKLFRLNLKSYPLDMPITSDQLYNYLSLSPLSADLQVKKGPVNVYFIYKNETIHVVFLDSDKKKFSIACTKTLLNQRLKNGMKDSSKKMYRNAVLASPVIKGIIENAIDDLKQATE